MHLSSFEQGTPSPFAPVASQTHEGLLHNISVLLVEDEIFIATDLVARLEEAGAKVFFARTFRRGMALIADAERVFDIALLDVTLDAGRTCVPIADALKEAGVPILLHTGDLDRLGEVVAEIGAPVHPKPAAAEDVVRRLATLLSD